MSQQLIDVGNVAGDGTGDTLYAAFTKTNNNFSELYSTVETQGLTYVNVASTTSSAGTGARFTVTRFVNEYSATIVHNGSGYAVGNTVVIWGNALGGSSEHGLNNVTLTITSLANAIVGNIATFTTSGTPVQPVLSVAGRVGNVVLTVNDVLGAVTPADLQSNIANAKVVVSDWIAANIAASQNTADITGGNIDGVVISNATLVGTSGTFSTLTVTGLTQTNTLLVNSTATVGGNLNFTAAKGIRFGDGSFQDTAAASPDLSGYATTTQLNTSISNSTANAASQGAALNALRANITAANAAIATLEGSDFASNASLTAANVSIAAIQSSLSGYATTSAVNTLTANATTQGVEINSLRANITAANATIAALQSVDFATNASVIAANAAIAGLRANVTASNVRIANTENNITALQANSATQGAILNSLTANAGTQSTEIADLRANVTAANAAIASLVSNAASQGATLTALSANAILQQNDLNSLTANAAGQTTALNTLTANAASQAVALAGFEANAVAQAGLINALTANAGTQGSLITALYTNAAIQTGQLTALTANASAQTVEIAGVRANVEAANAAIANLESSSLTVVDLAPYATVAQLTANVNNMTSNAAGQAIQMSAIRANVTAANAEIQLRASISGQTFTGNVTVPNLNVTTHAVVGGNVYADRVTATSINATTGTFSSVGGTLTTASQTNITAIGTLSTLSVTGNVTAGNVSGATGNFTNVVGSLYGNVVGNITGTTGTFTNVTGTLQTASQTNITAIGTLGTLAVTGNVTTGNVSGTTGTFGNIRGKLLDPNQSNITTIGNLTTLAVSNDSYFGANVWVVGNVRSNNVFSNLVTGTTAGFTDIVGTIQTASQPYITAIGTLGTLSVTGNVTASNISAELVTGTLTTASQPNITAVGTLDNLDVSNDVTVGHDLTVVGNLYISGNTTSVDTQQLTVTDLNIIIGNGAPNAISANLGGITLAGADASMTYFYPYDSWVFNKEVGLPGLVVGDYVQLANLLLTNGDYIRANGESLLSNLTLTNVQGTVATFSTVNGNITGTDATFTNVSASLIAGTLTTASQTNITQVGTLVNLDVTGNVTTGNIEGATGTFTSIRGSVLDANQTNITQVGTLVDLDVTGNVTTGNIEGATGTFTDIRGAVLDASQTNITQVGTLVDLDVTGNVTTGNVEGATGTFTNIRGAVLDASQTNITAVGTLVDLDVTGNVTTGNVEGATGTFTNIRGAILDASQTNITQVGTLVDLDVTGNVTTGNIEGATGTFTDIRGAILDASQTNITQVGTLVDLDVTGNVTTGNVEGATGTFTNIRGAVLDASQTNITQVGTLVSLGVTGNASAGNVSGTTGTFTNIRGTILDASQTNITQVGTLVSLGVTGNATTGNVSGATGTFTSIRGAILDASQTNITTVGTLIGLSVTNAIATGSINTSNAQITGGNVSVATATATNFSTANAVIAGGNITATPIGVANPSTGAFTTLQATGVSYLGNVTANLIQLTELVANTRVTGTLLSGYIETQNQPNITAVGTLVSLGVTGNASAGNLTVTNTITTGNINIAGTLGILNINANLTGVTANVDGITVTGTAFANSTVSNAVIALQYLQSPLSQFGNILMTSTANLLAQGEAVGRDTGTKLEGVITIPYGGAAFGKNVVTQNDFVSDKLYTNNAFVTQTITAGNLSVFGIIASGNVSTGNVSALTGVFTDVVGHLYGDADGATATYTQFNGNATGTNGSFTNLTGTLQTNAQPNITSVGSLTSLDVTGNITSGNISGTTADFVNLSGAIVTNAQPYITTVGNLVNLQVDGNITLTGSFDASQGNVLLGQVSELNVIGTVDVQGMFTANGGSTFNSVASFYNNVDVYSGNVNFFSNVNFNTTGSRVSLFDEQVINSLYLGSLVENMYIGGVSYNPSYQTRIENLTGTVWTANTLTLRGGVLGNTQVTTVRTYGNIIQSGGLANAFPVVQRTYGGVVIEELAANASLMFWSNGAGISSIDTAIIANSTAIGSYATTLFRSNATNIPGTISNAFVFTSNVFYIANNVPTSSLVMPDPAGGTSLVQVDPPVKLTFAGDSFATNQGAVLVAGGMGVAKNIFVGGNINVAQNSTFQSNITVVNLQVTGAFSAPGIVLPALNSTIIGNVDPKSATFTDINIVNTRSNVRALSFDLTNGRRLDPRMSYTRTGNAAVATQSGNVVYVAANTPPIHFDANGVCQGLLIEGATTNLFKQSTYFANTLVYSSYGLSTVAGVSGPGAAGYANATAVLSPFGTTGVASLVEDASSNLHGFSNTYDALTPATYYTASLFVKANTRSQISMGFQGEGDGPIFDLSYGNVVANGAAVYSSEIRRINTDFAGQHWYRIFVTLNKTTVNANCYVALARTGTVSYTGQLGLGGAFVTGMQLEAARYGSGFVETGFATASRGAATVSITQANTAWAGNTIGTALVMQASLNNGVTTNSLTTGRFALASFEGDAGNRMQIYVQDAPGSAMPRAANVAIYQGSALQANLAVTTAGWLTGQRIGTSIRFNDISAVADGGPVTNDLVATLPAWTTLYIGSSTVGGLSTWNGTVNRIAIYPKQIEDGALQASTKRV